MFFILSILLKAWTNVLRRFSPIQWLVIGYATIVWVIASLLTLPSASSQHISQPFIDALFTATSGISTTGLTVVDIGNYYSLFGQILILIDFQIGGLSHMTFFVILILFVGRRTSVLHRLVARESIVGAHGQDFYRFFKAVLLFTLLFEFVGASALAWYWSQFYPLKHAIWLGTFHSISAFCTAGFSLFSTSFMAYRESVPMNLIITILSICGGIGFFVLLDLYTKLKSYLRRSFHYRLAVHTKLAIWVSAAVYLVGTATLFFLEDPSHFFGNADQFKASLFQAVSASTTDGFNTIDISAMHVGNLVLLIALMFMGASPGGTGGGLKTTTMAMIVIATFAKLAGRSDVNVFHRKIPEEIIFKSLMILFCFSTVIGMSTLLLTITEDASFLQLFFETISAWSNTGLSLGITSQLSTVGKLCLIIGMFIGRVGPLTFGFALLEKRKKGKFQYAEAEVFVG
ncbi:MAG: Trk family potassium uptake protein [Deltaproteobacteria bacterium]|nr:Trk family potassium uptake protein [Deltaproteobacteria bacterium]